MVLESGMVGSGSYPLDTDRFGNIKDDAIQRHVVMLRSQINPKFALLFRDVASINYGASVVPYGIFSCKDAGLSRLERVLIDSNISPWHHASQSLG
jgi:hypothetical protein